MFVAKNKPKSQLTPLETMLASIGRRENEFLIFKNNRWKCIEM